MADESGDHRTDSWENPVDENGSGAKNEIAHLENRVEIDTSPPFESVKEAVCMFGGKGVWKPHNQISSPIFQSNSVDAEVTKVEEGTLRLEKDLFMKEQETLDVLKELDKTKRIVEQLKSKLQKGPSEDSATLISNASSCCGRQEILPVNSMFGPCVGRTRPTFTGGVQVVSQTKAPEASAQIKSCETKMELTDALDVIHATEREKDYVHVSESSPQQYADSTLGTNSKPISLATKQVNPATGTLVSLSQKYIETNMAPGEILMQLKQAKINLSRATGSLSEVRASIKSLDAQLAAEKSLLAKTRERLDSKYRSIASMEEKLNETLLKFQPVKDAQTKGHSGKLDISRALQDLHSEAELYQKMAEAAKSDVLRTMIDIEHTKAGIKTAEIRCNAAKKMEEAARVSELALLAEKEALEKSQNAETGFIQMQQHSGLTISHEEYCTLASNAKEAGHDAKKRIEVAMLKVDEANASKLEMLKELQRAAADVKVCREALQKALVKAENANDAKLAAEESLRRWRAEHSQQRRSIQSPMKFKNSYPVCRRENSRNPVILDVNGVNLIGDQSNRVLKPTLSIGQILSRKLVSADGLGIDLEPGEHKVSLAQMLRRRNGVLPSDKSQEGAMMMMQRQFSVKRKKWILPHFALHLVKGKKKQKF